MGKEDKPLEYQRRIRDTKGVAQRLDLGYLRRPGLLLLLRKRITWVLLAIAAAACVPLVLGIGGGRRFVENGPLSEAHAIFEKRCEVCHTQTFGGVPDKACQSCHDGAPHHAGRAQARCAECHLEHRGKVSLAAVADANCTRCHADLKESKIKATKITAFTAGNHPEFSRGEDTRPLKLNHAIHMPAQARVLRGMKLPMKCVDCHVPDKSTPDARFLPVTFDANCKSCHARELEYDVYHLGIPPAPHKATREMIAKELQGRAPRIVADSETYLFDKKCVYCHAGKVGESFRNVNPDLPKSEFDHRRHRAVDCDSCHMQARTSTKTADVLLPAIKSCTPCHESSQCNTCHRFHNRSLEKDHAKPLRELVGRASSLWDRPPGLSIRPEVDLGGLWPPGKPGGMRHQDAAGSTL